METAKRKGGTSGRPVRERGDVSCMIRTFGMFTDDLPCGVQTKGGGGRVFWR